MSLLNIAKGTIIFSGPDCGWSESYYRQYLAGIDLNNVAADLNTVAVARAAMLGKDYRIKALRASIEFDAGGLPVIGDSQLVYVSLTGPTAVESAHPDLAALALFGSANGLRKKFTYLRGIPRNVTSPTGGLVITTAFNTAFGAYVTALVGQQGNGWGWIGRFTTRGVTNYVTGYTVDPLSGLVTLTVTPGAFATLVGTKQTIRIQGLNQGRSELNGEVVVNILTTNTAETVKPYGVRAFVSRGILHVYSHDLIKFQGARLQKLIERKVGSPLLGFRGRQRVRIRN